MRLRVVGLSEKGLISVGMEVPISAQAAGTLDTEDPDILQGLVSHAGMLVIKLDLEGRVVWFNNVFATVTGQELQAMRGRDWVEVFIPEEERGATRAQCRRGALARGGRSRAEKPNNCRRRASKSGYRYRQRQPLARFM